MHERWTVVLACLMAACTGGVEPEAVESADEHAGITRVRCIVGEPVDYVPGDADRSGRVDAADVAVIASFVEGTGMRPHLEAADYDGDGRVDSDDADALSDALGRGAVSGASVEGCQRGLMASGRETDRDEIACQSEAGGVVVLSEALADEGTDIVLAHPGGCESVIGLRPSGGSGFTLIDAERRAYFQATGGRVDGRLVVCANVLDTRDAGATNRDGAAVHRIERATVLCSVQLSTGEFSPMEAMDLGQGDDSAWIAAFDPDTAEIAYVRDSTHEPFFFWHDRREDSDGMYGAALTLGDDGVAVSASYLLEPGMPF